MPKLPKKSTMLEVIKRVSGYAVKLHLNGKLTAKEFTNVSNTMIKLRKAINK